jgi:hypothetical protein
MIVGIVQSVFLLVCPPILRFLVRFSQCVTCQRLACYCASWVLGVKRAV